jgi:hypothetical protein
MGLFDFLFKRKLQQQKQLQFSKDESTFILPEDVRTLSDSEKINLILQGVYSVFDELKPKTDEGGRVSRLNLILQNLSPSERKEMKNKIEEIDIDEQIVKELDTMVSIEKLSKTINKSYGYTAARLRHLKKQGRVTRKRDPKTNKFVYMRVPD